ncbi:hypothetical protein ACVGWH_04075, partial [Enterobacter asburiae]
LALILLQPKAEPEYDMKELQKTWDSIMATAPQPVQAATADDLHPDATYFPQGNLCLNIPSPCGRGLG